VERVPSIFVEMCVQKLFSLAVYSFFKLVLAMPLFPETEYIATKRSISQLLCENGFSKKTSYTTT